jgi:hypothetical protein
MMAKHWIEQLYNETKDSFVMYTVDNYHCGDFYQGGVKVGTTYPSNTEFVIGPDSAYTATDCAIPWSGTDNNQTKGRVLRKKGVDSSYGVRISVAGVGDSENLRFDCVKTGKNLGIIEFARMNTTWKYRICLDEETKGPTIELDLMTSQVTLTQIIGGIHKSNKEFRRELAKAILPSLLGAVV